MNTLIQGGALYARQLSTQPNNRKLSGTVVDDQGNGQRRWLLLLREASGIPGNLQPPAYTAIRLGRSANNGQWSFNFVLDGRYTVIAYDHTGQFDPVIKGGLIPELME